MNPETAIPFGRYFEDFAVDAVYQHSVRKTITESDNNLFCLLTMNHHPVHLDLAYAGEAQHGKVLVVGTLVLSLVVGLTVADISGRAIANLGYDEVRHEGPVHIGDTLRAESLVENMRQSESKADRGVVQVSTKAYNQHDQLVLSFRRNVLVPLRSASV